MNKQINVSIFRHMTIVGVLCVGLFGSVACSPKTTSNKLEVPSRIIILEVTSVNGDSYTIFRDKETDRDYVYIDGYNSGCVTELRSK